MLKRKWVVAVAAAALLSGLALKAHAASYDVDLSGWLAADDFDFGNGPNSSTVVNLPAGSLVTGWQYSSLRFTTNPNDASWLSDLTLSVNRQEACGCITAWMDWKPSTTDSPGTFGPESGSWNGVRGSHGPYGSTGPFMVLPGSFLLVTSYLDAYYPSAGIDIASGTLRINYEVAAVPEPAGYALMALGLIAVAAAARRKG